MKPLLKSEWIKIRNTKIWWLLTFSPLLVGITGMTMPMPEEGPQWVFLLSTGVSIHALLFLPLMVAVFSAYICRYEHQHNAWKQLFTMPVSRRHVFMAKYVIVALVIAVNQCLFFLTYFGVGFTRGLEGAIPWDYLFRSLAGGWVATLPLAALTLWVALVWSSFAAAITVNVILTMPNMFVVNSETFGPLYPWAQPFLMMLPQSEGIMGGFFVSVESMMVAVIGGFLVFFIGGLTSIHRKVV
ncbi:ABC transporter permease [Halobacillus locisalis]|uniref:ABC transporter permease n=1 Tax=Halobacillus locisalis TaxID=220753 RepID=A0A838CTK5_9BACI|nr:ABC transporter permease [Halobacillus locisalis]MBA2175213.1 ABC transporter permease [Halobacillus locisalis]